MHVDVSRSEIFKYQCCRQRLRSDNNTDPVKIGSGKGLDAGLLKLILYVTNHWDRVPGGEKDFDAFRAATEGLFADESLTDVARAMAAEHRSSCDEGEARIEWGGKALAFSAGLTDTDARTLRNKIVLGEYDKGGRAYTDADVKEALDYAIMSGGHDAPGRVLWWVGRLEERGASKNEILPWLLGVTSTSTQIHHAMNLYYLGKAEQKLQELLAS